MEAFIFSFFCWILVVVLLVPVLLVLIVLKTMVLLVAKIFRPDLQMLSSADAALTEDVRSKPLYSIGVVLKLEEAPSTSSLSIQDLRTHFAKTFLQNPHGEYHKFFKIYTSFGGYYFWKRCEDVCVENQVTEQIVESEESLDDYLTTWIKSPYRKSCPMWQMTLVKWPKAGVTQATAIAFRIHHAYADGISIMKVVHKMAETTLLEGPKLQKPRIRLWPKVEFMFIFPYLMLRFALRISAAPRNLFPDVVENSSLTFFSMNLKEFKEISKAANVPFASVLMKIVGNVFGKLLEEDGREVPQFVYLGNALPWPDRKEPLCNEWAIGAFKVPMGAADPVVELQEVGKDMTEYLKSGFHIAAKPIMFGTASLFPIGLARQLSKSFLKETIPLAPFPIMSGSLLDPCKDSIKILGRSVVQAFPVVTNANPHIALGCVSITKLDKMHLTIVVEQSCFPNVQNIKEKVTNHFISEFSRLSQSVKEIKQG